MVYDDFLEKIIKDGIIYSEKKYAKNQEKLMAATLGLDACRNKKPNELLGLLNEARKITQKTNINSKLYIIVSTYELTIEWVCNCIAAMMIVQKQKPIVQPTMRGFLKMSEVLRVRS